MGALGCAARIAGVRTRRMAISISLSNFLMLISRISYGLIGALVASRMETSLANGGGDTILYDLRIMILSASIGMLIGTILVPTSQRIFTWIIIDFDRNRSTFTSLRHLFTLSGLSCAIQCAAMPSQNAIRDFFTKPRNVKGSLLLGNCLAQALFSVGALAALYAGYLNPEFRVTASQLSPVVNGFATILLFSLIDPQVSAMSEDVIDGMKSEASFRRALTWLLISSFIGTILAQIIMVPAANLIVLIAENL